MTDKFKVGDDVFYFKHGWGKVVENKTDGMNSIKIRFKIGSTDVSGATATLSDVVFATLEGRTETTDAFPVILTVGEAAKLGHFPPKKKVKYYPVLLRHGENGGYFIALRLYKTLEEAKKEFCTNSLMPKSSLTVVRLITEVPELIKEVEE